MEKTTRLSIFTSSSELGHSVDMCRFARDISASRNRGAISKIFKKEIPKECIVLIFCKMHPTIV